jgi:serine/arginine repetitive matrix protein 2
MAEAPPRMVKPLMSAASSAPEVLQDSDDDLDLDEGDFAGSEAKYNRERELLEARKVDLSAPHLRAMSPLHEIMMLHALTTDFAAVRVEEPEVIPMEEDVHMQDEITQVPPMPAVEESATIGPLTPRREDGDDITMGEIEEEEESSALYPT